MYALTQRLALAGLALAGLTPAGSAQVPATVPAGGPELILQGKTTDGRSMNVVSNSGNGFGNRIAVSGAPGSMTLVQNSRNGIGNELVVTPTGPVLDLDRLGCRIPPLGTYRPDLGIGSRIVVGGTPGSVTVIQSGRNGIENRLVTPDDLAIDIDAMLAELFPPVAKQAAPAPVAPPSYKGKASPFWTKKAFSDAYDCNLYWCPTTKLWFRYHAEEDTYRPVPVQPEAPPEEK